MGNSFFLLRVPKKNYDKRCKSKENRAEQLKSDSVEAVKDEFC